MEINARTAPTEPWGQKRIGDWIQTRMGVKFHLLDPHPEDFRIEDIAHALAHQCRFAGHTRRFYSIAEHSVRVANAVAAKLGDADSPLVYAGLMHDASDAYMLDMPRPFKYLPKFAVYKQIEHDLMVKMSEVFRFAYPKPEIVGWADNALLGTESRDLFDMAIDDWSARYERLPGHIRPWSPAKAKRRFLAMFYRLNPLGICKPSAWRWL